MQRTLAKIFGFIVLACGIVGLIVGDKQLFGFMNVDLALDIARLLLAALLLYAAYKGTEGWVRGSLWVFTLLYLGLGVIGLFSRDVGGILPHELSVFDIVLHIGAGLIGLWAVTRRSTTTPANS